VADNIIVLDHIFNLTKKSNLFGRLYYDLTLFFDNLGVAYFFGPPCRLTIALSKNSNSICLSILFLY